jgi:hypothetical protein
VASYSVSTCLDYSSTLKMEATCSFEMSVGFYRTTWNYADHGDRAVKGMDCLRSLESWDRRFESHSSRGCLCLRLFCVCVVLCIGSGLAMGSSPVQGVLPAV